MVPGPGWGRPSRRPSARLGPPKVRQPGHPRRSRLSSGEAGRQLWQPTYKTSPPAGAHRESHRRPAAARTRRRDGGGLLRGFLSALGPIGGHPLGHRILLFGRHRTALPRRLGVGRGLRDRGGRSRRPPRGGAPSHGLRRRGGGPEDLVDVVQRLDLRLQALDLTLPVGDCLCYWLSSAWPPPPSLWRHRTALPRWRGCPKDLEGLGWSRGGRRSGADGASAMARRPRRQDGAAWCCSRATWASGQAGHPERRCLSPRPWRANVRGWRRRLVEPGDAAAAASRRAATTCRRRAWDGQRVSPVVPPAGAEVVPAGTADRATCRRSHPHVDPPPADPAEQDLCRAADAVAYPAGDVELAGKELQRRRTRHHG